MVFKRHFINLQRDLLLGEQHCHLECMVILSFLNIIINMVNSRCQEDTWI